MNPSARESRRILKVEAKEPFSYFTNDVTNERD